MYVAAEVGVVDLDCPLELFGRQVEYLEPGRHVVNRVAFVIWPSPAVGLDLRGRTFDDVAPGHCPHPERASGVGVHGGDVHPELARRGQLDGGALWRLEVAETVGLTGDGRGDGLGGIGIRHLHQTHGDIGWDWWKEVQARCKGIPLFVGGGGQLGRVQVEDAGHGHVVDALDRVGVAVDVVYFSEHVDDVMAVLIESVGEGIVHRRQVVEIANVPRSFIQVAPAGYGGCAHRRLQNGRWAKLVNCAVRFQYLHYQLARRQRQGNMGSRSEASLRHIAYHQAKSSACPLHRGIYCHFRCGRY